MSPTCSRNDRMVVLHRLVLSLLPDSIKLSSNMGFSYTKTLRQLRHRHHPLCSLSLAAHTRANPLEPCLCGQVNDFTTHRPVQAFTFSFGCAALPVRTGMASGFLPRPARHSW